jgi:MurNAc alpha-1-phosphate uridylyltransferase
MVLAAGKGQRLHPFTLQTPKVLMTVAGQTLLDHALDKLGDEPALLDTGGGIANALPHFHNEAFFVINADVWWQDAGQSCLHFLNRYWNPASMDALMLLIPRECALGYTGRGDYHLMSTGRIQHRKDEGSAPYIYGGIRLMHPRMLAAQKVYPFSIVPYFHEAERHNRLYGLVFQGSWGDAGTPESWQAINAHALCHQKTVS